MTSLDWVVALHVYDDMKLVHAAGRPVEVEAGLGEIEQPKLERWAREAEANANRRPGIS